MINKEWLKKQKECQLTVTHKTRSFSGKGNAPALLSLVYHHCGKRLTLGKEVFKILGKPKTILISTLDEFLVIRAGEESGYKLSATDKGKPILYNAEVVRLLLKTFNLDLEGRSTLSFYEGEYCEGAYYIKIIDSKEEEIEEVEVSDTTEGETCEFCDENDTEEAENLSFENEEEEEEDLDEVFCD